MPDIEHFDPYPRIISILKTLATDPNNTDVLAKECGIVKDMFIQIDEEVAKIENIDISVDEQEMVIKTLEERIARKKKLLESFTKKEDVLMLD